MKLPSHCDHNRRLSHASSTRGSPPPISSDGSSQTSGRSPVAKRITEDRGRAVAILAILLTTIVWGLSFISTKSLLIAGLTPVQVAFARFVVACVIFAGLCAGRAVGRRGVVRKLPAGSGVRVLIGGILGVPVYFLLENTGLRLTSASTASLITGTMPVINAVATVLLLRSKVSGLRWTGIAMSCAGVYTVAQVDLATSLSSLTLMGNLMVFLSACSWVAYTMINRPLLDQYDNLTLNTYQNVAGTLFLLPIALYDGMPVASWGMKVWLNILYLGAVCSALSYILYLFALKRLGSTVVTSFLNLVPLFGVLGGVVLLGEALSWVKALGGLLAITGVYLVSAGGTRTGAPAAADAELAGAARGIAATQRH